ncbi:hypothetical protein [Nocardia xishanensis]|uniref:hypothetical protein n=1 Tax=Nocardia xishanensis TaxID=238964 RepID=UPI00343C4A74
MPLTDIESSMALMDSLVDEMESSDNKRLTQAVLPAIGVLFTELAAKGACYCGVGYHLSLDGSLITSCLTVSACDLGTKKMNPRLLLKEIIDSRSEAGESGRTEVLQIDGRSILFAEKVSELPTPQLPGVSVASAETETYQLEAIVPAADGDALAAIELSTPFVEHGPQFRKMIVDMARSIKIEPDANRHQEFRPSSLDL